MLIVESNCVEFTKLWVKGKGWMNTIILENDLSYFSLWGKCPIDGSNVYVADLICGDVCVLKGFETKERVMVKSKSSEVWNQK